MIVRLYFAALLLSASVLPAATILERQVDLRVEGSTLHEREKLLVALESVADLDSWKEYPVWLDEHIELVECVIEVLDERGGLVKSIPRRKLREETSVGFGLHSSGRALVADLPVLAVGQRIRVDVSRRITPLFGDAWVVLVQGLPQSSLRVTVRGGNRLRWRLDDADEVVNQTEENGTLILTGRDISAWIPPDHTAAIFSTAPRLSVAWDKASDWPAIGAWYSELTADVKRQSEEIEALARKLTADLEGPLQRLLAVAEYARSMVRYEAVEVGEGAWVPTPGVEVVHRGWGDCKDKSQLLVELLNSLDIPAHLVLIHNGIEGRLNPQFPSLLGVNHCVAAIPADALPDLPADVAVDGLVFIDPTMDRGDVLWLSPYLFGQYALVAAGSSSRLVQLPTRFAAEARRLEVNGVVSATGTLAASAMLRLEGSRAIAWLRGLDTEEEARLLESVHRFFQSLLPGALISGPALRPVETEVPTVVLTARLDLQGFLRGGSTVRLRPPHLSALPEPRELDDRDEVCVLTPGVHLSRWRIVLPDGVCPPDAAEEVIENDLGTMRSSVGIDGEGRLVVQRVVEMRDPWITPQNLQQLVELSVAESRANRRSLRLRCPDPE